MSIEHPHVRDSDRAVHKLDLPCWICPEGARYFRPGVQPRAKCNDCISAILKGLHTLINPTNNVRRIQPRVFQEIPGILPETSFFDGAPLAPGYTCSRPGHAIGSPKTRRIHSVDEDLRKGLRHDLCNPFRVYCSHRMIWPGAMPRAKISNPVGVL